MNSVDNTRRAPPPPPPPPPAPPPSMTAGSTTSPSTDAVAPATREVQLAGENAANEVRGEELQRFTVDKAPEREPPMPSADPMKTSERNLPTTASEAVQNAPPGVQRDTLIETLNKRAGIDDPSGTGRVEDHKVVQRSNAITTELTQRAQMNPERLDKIPGTNQALTDDEKAGLRDPATRFETAQRIGDRTAQQEGVNAAFGGQPNLQKVEAAWQAMSPDQKRETMAEAQKLAQERADQAKQIARDTIPFVDAAIKSAEGDYDGAAKSAAVDAALAAAAGPIGRGLGKLASVAAGKVDDAARWAKGLLTKGDDVAKGAKPPHTTSTPVDPDFATRQSALGREGLARQLQNEAQHAQLRAGQGEVIMGAGHATELKQATELARKYGGRPEDWQKVRSKSVTDPDGVTHREIHAYQNRTRPGEIFEAKTKETRGFFADRGLDNMGDILRRGRELFPGF